MENDKDGASHLLLGCSITTRLEQSIFCNMLGRNHIVQHPLHAPSGGHPVEKKQKMKMDESNNAIVKPTLHLHKFNDQELVRMNKKWEALKGVHHAQFAKHSMIL